MRDWRLAIIVLGVLVLLLLIVLAFALRRYRALHAELREPEVRDLREPIVIISDPGEDLDDEMAIIMARFLEDEGLIELRAVIANLQPAHARARLMRATLDQLRLNHVPVGSGTDGGAPSTVDCFSETADYMPPVDSERARQIEPGRALLHRVLATSEPNTVTLLCISSLKDAALFLRDNGELCASRLKRVVVMGGVDASTFERAAARARVRANSKEEASPRAGGSGGADGDSSDEEVEYAIVPDSAHNNAFDFKAAAFLCAACQHAGIPLTVVTRFAAYAAPVRREVYDHLAQSGSPIGWRLRKVQRDSIERLWRRACAPPGSAARQGLPDRCDREWFSTTFCRGRVGTRGTEDPVWDLVVSFNMYDVLALIACSPPLAASFFEPATIVGQRGARHEVIGLSADAPGVSAPRDLSIFVLQGIARAIGAHVRTPDRQAILLVLHDSPTSPAAPALLLLRGLLEANAVHCAALLIFEAASSSSAARPSLIALCDQVGLSAQTRVERFRDDSNGSDGDLERVSAAFSSIPHGATLVLACVPLLIAQLARQRPLLFREHTEAVLSIGALTPPPASPASPAAPTAAAGAGVGADDDASSDGGELVFRPRFLSQLAGTWIAATEPSFAKPTHRASGCRRAAASVGDGSGGVRPVQIAARRAHAAQRAAASVGDGSGGVRPVQTAAERAHAAQRAEAGGARARVDLEAGRSADADANSRPELSARKVSMATDRATVGTGADPASATHNVPPLRLVADPTARLPSAREAAVMLGAQCLALGVPLVLLPAGAEAELAIPANLLRHMANTGGPVGAAVEAHARAAFETCWRLAQLAPANARAADWPDAHDARWFGEEFCDGGVPPPPGLANVWSVAARVPAPGCALLCAAAARPRAYYYETRIEAARNGTVHLELCARARAGAGEGEGSADGSGRGRSGSGGGGAPLEQRAFVAQLISKAITLDTSLFDEAIIASLSTKVPARHRSRPARQSRMSWRGIQVSGLGTLSVSDELPEPLRPRADDQPAAPTLRSQPRVRRMGSGGSMISAPGAKVPLPARAAALMDVESRLSIARAAPAVGAAGGNDGRSSRSDGGIMVCGVRADDACDDASTHVTPAAERARELRLLAQLEEERLDELLETAVGADLSGNRSATRSARTSLAPPGARPRRATAECTGRGNGGVVATSTSARSFSTRPRTRPGSAASACDGGEQGGIEGARARTIALIRRISPMGQHRYHQPQQRRSGSAGSAAAARRVSPLAPNRLSCGTASCAGSSACAGTRGSCVSSVRVSLSDA